MISLEDKIEAAQKLIEQVRSAYGNPVVMSSFGKDSMVMLDLLDRKGIKLPILFHREPFFPKKYEFANRIIAEREYVVYDYPPLTTAVTKNGQAVEIVNFYSVGKHSTYVPTGIREPEEGKPFLCGYLDLYGKPTGSFDFPWDVAFVAHKATDVDPILGPIPLAVDIKLNDGSCHYAYPLRHFTDQDVWAYRERFGVPFNEKRYDRANGYREFSDITYNPDYHHACVRCMDRDQPEVVFCPKFQRELTNISRQIRYLEPEVPAYLGGTHA